MQPGEYAVALREIGEFLDVESALRATLAFGPDTVTLQWHTLGGAVERRHYLLHDLGELAREARETEGPVPRRQAPSERSNVSAESPNPRAERFAALGRYLDEERIELIGISETATGVRVLGSRRGEYVDVFFPTEH
jgi:hypothetical protein